MGNISYFPLNCAKVKYVKHILHAIPLQSLGQPGHLITSHYVLHMWHENQAMDCDGQVSVAT